MDDESLLFPEWESKQKTAWEKEWQGMPEFIQDKQEAYKTLIIRFDNEEDYQEFASLINQKLTSKTKSIWHPELQRGKYSHLFYHGESNES